MLLGKTNDNEYKLIARHEIKCTLEDIAKISSYLLKDNGKLFMIHKTDRLSEIISTFKKNKLEPKRLRFVYSNKNSDSNLVLIEFSKNGNEFLKVEKPLYVYNEDGTYTNEIFDIYGKEKE